MNRFPWFWPVLVSLTPLAGLLLVLVSASGPAVPGVA